VHNIRSTPRDRMADRCALFPLRRQNGPAASSLAAVIAIQLSQVAIDVLINQWNNRFYNALQDRKLG